MAVSYILFLIQACRTFVVLLLGCKHGSAWLSLFCNLKFTTTSTIQECFFFLKIWSVFHDLPPPQATILMFI